jgi:Domain of unknown function (DUF1707)/2TM domain
MCYAFRASANHVEAGRRVGTRRTWPTDPDARIGDADRDKVVTLLGDAAAEGYLLPDELDERLDAALAARTVDDLEQLTRDLPPEWRAERARRATAVAAQRAARESFRPRVATYVRVMALLVGIWLILGITAGAWYPWPIWPALGWGIALIAQRRAPEPPEVDRRPTPPRVKIGA